MKKLASIIVLVVLCITFLDVHNYSGADGSDNLDVTASNVANEVGTQKNDIEQDESKNIFHKHCSVSCFVIPADHSVAQISLKKSIGVYETGYVELVLANRLKRPPRKSV